jgi:hypothetical protein
MIYDFIIIPIDNNFVNIAFYIRDKLEEIYYLSNIIIDTNYNDKFSSRVNRSREKNINIITINNDYDKTKMVNVIFQHTNFKVESMSLQHFLELIATLNNNDENRGDKISLSCIII